MDRITRLSDDVLLKILSFLPTKVAVSTSILSKRWEFLWMWLPNLEICGVFLPETDWEKLKRFLDSKLSLHRALVIESFHLKFLIPNLEPENIKLWLVIAISRQLRELDIYYINRVEKSDILPSSLYNCKSLVTLKLSGGIRFDVPRMVCLPSLKTLQLEKVNILPGESLGRLLSTCPVLENLLLDTSDGHDSGKISVVIPSLQSLTLILPCKGNIEGLEIRTPSLKYLKLDAHDNDVHRFSIENMPKLEEAYLDVRIHDNIKSLMRSIASVKRLTLCLPAAYGEAVIFNQLEYLKLCDCRIFSLNVLTRLLNDSPRLRVLDIFQMEDHDTRDMAWCSEPSTAKCLVSSLQTFKWSGYLGRFAEQCIAVYILENARCLKTATISSSGEFNPKFRMLQELSSSSRASSSCKLLFH